MKTRNRTTSSTLPEGQVFIDHYDPITGAFIERQTGSLTAFTYNGLVESITDEEPKRQYAGFCEHSKSSVDLYGANIVFSFTEGRRYTYTYTGGFIARYCIVPRLHLLTDPISVDSIDWGSNSYLAMESMREELSKTTLLGAFLGEIGTKAPKRAWTTFRSFFHRSTPTLTSFRNYLLFQAEKANKAVGRIESTSKAIAKANLFYQFGLRPFVLDVSQMVETLSGLHKTIDKVLAEAAKPRIKHYSRNLDIIRLPAGEDEEVWWADAYKNRLVRNRKFVTRPKYHATCTYSLDVERLRGVMGKIRGYIHAIGLDAPLSTFWELTRFSFLVDWFIDVGGWLKSIEREFNDPLPMLIREFQHSVKYETETTITWQSWVTESLPGSVPRIYASTRIASARTRYYKRQRDTPCLTDLKSAKGLTVNRVGLASSLIRANLKKKPQL